MENSKLLIICIRDIIQLRKTLNYNANLTWMVIDVVGLQKIMSKVRKQDHTLTHAVETKVLIFCYVFLSWLFSTLGTTLEIRWEGALNKINPSTLMLRHWSTLKWRNTINSLHLYHVLAMLHWSALLIVYVVPDHF